MTATLNLDDPQLQQLDAIAAACLAQLRPADDDPTHPLWSALVARLADSPATIADLDAAHSDAACAAVGRLGVALADSLWNTDAHRVDQARAIVDDLAAALGLPPRAWDRPFGQAS